MLLILNVPAKAQLVKKKLLSGGLLPFWSDLGRLAPMRRALLGMNASVVGILLAALFLSLIHISEPTRR